MAIMTTIITVIILKTMKYWVSIWYGIVSLMGRKNSSGLGGSLSRDGVLIKIPVAV